MLTITTHFAAILGYIICCGILVGKVWMHNAYQPQKNISKLLIQSIYGLFLSLGTYFSVIMIDAFVKIVILGITGYANISYHIGGLLLCLIFGIIFIIGAGLNAPTIRTLVNFVITIGISIYFIWFSYDVLFPDFEKVFYLPVIYIIASLFIVNLIWTIILLVIKRNPLEEKRIWDFSTKYKKIFSGKAFIVFWLLFGIEIALKFEGLGLLHWF